MMSIRLAPVLALLAVTGCSAKFCVDSSAFWRDASLFSGEIHGRAVDDGGAAIPFAQVRVPGTQRTVRADSSGNFVLWDLEAGAWILNLTSDVDGDGIPERRRLFATTLREAAHRRDPELIPGTAQTTSELTGVDVGPVTLEGTAQVSGQVLLEPPDGGAPVPPAQLDKNVVVVAARNFGLPRVTADGLDLVSLGAEVKTGVDAAGNFQLRNVGAGSLHLLLLVFDASVPAGDLLGFERASEPVFVRALPEVPTQLGQPLVLPWSAAQALATAPVQLLVTPDPPDGTQLYAVFVPPGQQSPGCVFPPPDYASGTGFPYARETEVVTASSLVTLGNAPVGLWDLKVCVSGDDSPQGVLYAQTVQAESAELPAVLVGPVLLGPAVDPCLQYRGRCRDAGDCGAGGLLCEFASDGDEFGRCAAPSDEEYLDCDGDGLRGLPTVPPTGAVPAVWLACAEDCTDDAVPVGQRSCSAEGEGWDCDDDGDGQADVTEDPACYGLGKGIDSDSDGVCDGVDQFPECAANNPTDCVAGTDDDPHVRPEFEGGVCPVFFPGGESEPGRGFFSYCDVSGQEASACERYEMVCEALDSSGSAAELFPRRCGEDAGCAAPGVFGVQAECVSGRCSFENAAGCEQACPFGFACVPGAGVADRCVADDSVTATVNCVCTDAATADSERVVTVSDVSMRYSRCTPSDPEDTTFQTLWTSTGEGGCGFPMPSSGGVGGAGTDSDGGPPAGDCTFSSPDLPVSECTYNGEGTCTDQQMVCFWVQSDEPFACYTDLQSFGLCEAAGHPNSVCETIGDPTRPTVGTCVWTNGCLMDSDCAASGYSCDVARGECRGNAAEISGTEYCDCLQGAVKRGSFDQVAIPPASSCIPDATYADGLWEQCRTILANPPSTVWPEVGTGCQSGVDLPVCENSLMLTHCSEDIWETTWCNGTSTCATVPCLSGDCTEFGDACVNDADLGLCNMDLADPWDTGPPYACRAGERCGGSFTGTQLNGDCAPQFGSCSVGPELSCTGTVAQRCAANTGTYQPDFALSMDCSTLTSATCNAVTATCESQLGSQCILDPDSVVQPNAGKDMAICAQPYVCMDGGAGRVGTCVSPP